MRNLKGQFVKTTGNTKYKMVQYKGKRMGKHCMLMCVFLGISSIPKGFVVHHLDRNIYNNYIDNLALITVSAHNKMHSHTPWNKGMSAGVNQKWDKTIKKAQESRFRTFLPKFKEAFELQGEGKKLREIALIQGISRRQVSDRIKRYKEYIN